MKKICCITQLLMVLILSGCATNSEYDIKTEYVSADYQSEEKSDEVNEKADLDVNIDEDTKSKDEKTDLDINDMHQDVNDEENIDADTNIVYTEPFYGIFINASKNLKDEIAVQQEAIDYGFNAAILLTSEWDSLNPEPYYVVTCGRYNYKEEADLNLPKVQNYYPDAYIRFSGNYVGDGDGGDYGHMERVADAKNLSNDTNKKDSYKDGRRIDATFTSLSCFKKESDKMVMQAQISGEEDDVTLYVDDNTIFSDDCKMEYFGGYEVGMSPNTWMHQEYDRCQSDPTDFSLLGVYDMMVSGSHVDVIYGIYWWD